MKIGLLDWIDTSSSLEVPAVYPLR